MRALAEGVPAVGMRVLAPCPLDGAPAGTMLSAKNFVRRGYRDTNPGAFQEELHSR